MNRKIDIYVDGKYIASTIQAKTCKEAVAKYRGAYHPIGKVKAWFSKQ